LPYFIALNNYGICFIHPKDYEGAQRILYKAIDLSLAARKRGPDGIFIPLGQVRLLQLVLHLNLAFLLMDMHELAEAELQLREADELIPLVSKRAVAAWHDHYVGICALWEYESGKFAAAENELAKAKNPDFPSCLRVRAKLHIVRQEFAEAETLLRKYQDAERKKGTLHRPDLLGATLDFAESLFGQGKHDDAFAALEEARSIAADYALPADATWRQTLENWRGRAHEIGKADMAESLAADLHKMPAPEPWAILILDKLRVQK
jgi:tetratricopeptide (TPR) repeat protein